MQLSPMTTATAGPAPDHAALRAAATNLEASFLAEMLRHAGLGKAPTGFDGGAGEEHFASFLREAQAREVVRAGGIGLAATIFAAMTGAPRGA